MRKALAFLTIMLVIMSWGFIASAEEDCPDHPGEEPCTEVCEDEGINILLYIIPPIVIVFLIALIVTLYFIANKFLGK